MIQQTQGIQYVASSCLREYIFTFLKLKEGVLFCLDDVKKVNIYFMSVLFEMLCINMMEMLMFCLYHLSREGLLQLVYLKGRNKTPLRWD